jgi:hypothetical protein
MPAVAEPTNDQCVSFRDVWPYSSFSPTDASGGQTAGDLTRCEIAQDGRN